MAKALNINYYALFQKHKALIIEHLIKGLSIKKLSLILSEKEGYLVPYQGMMINFKSYFYFVKCGCTYKSVMLRGDVVRGVKLPQPNQCKFILSNNDLCENKIERGSYCEKHARVCYVKDFKKKDKS